MAPAEPQIAARESKLSNGKLELVVDNQGGAVRKLALVKYADRVVQPGEPVQPVDLVTVDELGILHSSLGNADYPGLERARFDVIEWGPVRRPPLRSVASAMKCRSHPAGAADVRESPSDVEVGWRGT